MYWRVGWRRAEEARENVDVLRDSRRWFGLEINLGKKSKCVDIVVWFIIIMAGILGKLRVLRAYGPGYGGLKGSQGTD